MQLADVVEERFGKAVVAGEVVAADAALAVHQDEARAVAQAAIHAVQLECVEAEIVDLRSLRPLDMDPVIESFKKTNRAVVVEEGWKSFGVGAEVSARIYEQAFDYVDAPVRRVAQKEVPLPYNRALEQSALPQVEDVVAAVKEVL